MPSMKLSFMRMKGVEAGALQALATRLAKVRFDMNSDVQVIGVDRDPQRLTVELAARRERESLVFDEEKGAFVGQKGYEYSRRICTLDCADNTASTPGARRDLAHFLELIKRCGLPGAELMEQLADLAAWTREFVKIYDSAQLGALVVDNFYAEPKLLGRYSAKTVDNRLDLKMLSEMAGKLRSIRLAFFHEGLRRTVEARADGVLSCASSDEEDLEGFFEEQIRLYLRHTSVPEKPQSK